LGVLVAFLKQPALPGKAPLTKKNSKKILKNKNHHRNPQCWTSHFKMTARPLPVIPPKYTGTVYLSHSLRKKFNVKKMFFDFLGTVIGTPVHFGGMTGRGRAII
jgi:hypothetical protein